MPSFPREPASSGNRLLTALYWIAPSLLCLLLYWFGLRAWFQKDDFAWLALPLRVHDWRSFLGALFEPLAQGTIRPWSERLYFLAGWWLFGMESPAFRVAAFATMFANLALLTAITRRITGSAVAGFAAPLLWLANGNLYIPMAWSSAYNQILCAFFLLLALWCWIRYTESGERRFLLGQWTAFVLGFGALEINVVYPALAALYAWCFARGYLRRTLPMFAVSIGYTALHRALAPAQATDTYRMYFDASVFDTLRRYLTWSFGADRYARFLGFPVWPHYVAEALVATALLGFSAVMLRRRERLPIFCAGWFLITLAPVLPLKNHVSDYYLTIPVIGFSMLGGWALASARGRSLALASLAVIAYAVPSAWLAQGMTRHYYDVSRRAAKLVRSVAYAHKIHPTKKLLVTGVDTDLFWQCWRDRPFVPLGGPQVYLSADSQDRIAPLRNDTPVVRYVLPDTLALRALQDGQLVVYQRLESDNLRNITPFYQARLERKTLELPAYLDIREPLSEMHLGAGWWPAEENHRWMQQRASLQLRPDGRTLVLRGVAPGACTMTVTIGGETSRHSLPAGAFETQVAVPPAVRGRGTVEISIEVDRTIRLPGDGRELGLAFGTAEIVP